MTSLKFLIDNNLSIHLTKGMSGFGENVQHLQDIFSDDIDDATLLQKLGENQIFLITRDDNIRFRPAEKSALIDHKVGVFFIGGKSLSRCQIIRQVVRHWPRIKEIANKNRNKRPFAFRVPPSGSTITKINL